MEANWLQYCATKEQLEHFDEQGYLIVEDALSVERVEKLSAAADRVDAREREKQGLAPGAMMAKFRSVIEDDAFFDLLDNEKNFPLLWDILGWNIQLYISICCIDICTSVAHFPVTISLFSDRYPVLFNSAMFGVGGRLYISTENLDVS